MVASSRAAKSAPDRVRRGALPPRPAPAPALRGTVATGFDPATRDPERARRTLVGTGRANRKECALMPAPSPIAATRSLTRSPRAAETSGTSPRSATIVHRSARATVSWAGPKTHSAILCRGLLVRSPRGKRTTARRAPERKIWERIASASAVSLPSTSTDAGASTTARCASSICTTTLSTSDSTSIAVMVGASAFGNCATSTGAPRAVNSPLPDRASEMWCRW